MPKSSQSEVNPDLPAPESDRRIWLRYPTHRVIYCQATARKDEPFWSLRACDISLGGIKLMGSPKFERGTILKLSVAYDGTDKSSYLTAEVRYATPSPEGKWIMGCAFVEKLNEKDLQAFVQESGSPSKGG